MDVPVQSAQRLRKVGAPILHLWSARRDLKQCCPPLEHHLPPATRISAALNARPMRRNIRSIEGASRFVGSHAHNCKRQRRDGLQYDDVTIDVWPCPSR